MPRRYYRRRRRYTRKRVRSRVKLMRGKRKAAKGQRQSEAFNIPMHFEQTITIQMAPQTAAVSFYDQLFHSTQFINMLESYDQFRLDAVSGYMSIMIPNGGTASPFELGIAIDRSGVPASDLLKADVTSYGSFKSYLSGVSAKINAKFYCAATTMQEKSQYISTDIQGVGAWLDTSFSTSVIPRHRNVYFPWNPNLLFYINGGPNWGAERLVAMVRVDLKFTVTFRGLRHISNPDDRVQPVNLQAGGSTDINFNPSVSMPTEVKITAPTSVGGPDVLNKNFGFASFPSNVLAPLLLKIRDYPQFNTVSSYVKDLATDVGRLLYDEWMTKILSYCTSTFASLFTTLGKYAFRSVSASIDSFVGSFLASDPRSTFYFSDNMATNGLPEDDSLALIDSDYISSFDIGVQFPQFLYSSAISVFNSSAVGHNEASTLYLYFSPGSYNPSTIKGLYNQDLTATNRVTWTQSIVSGSAVSIASNALILVQFPHANYWVTGFIYNKSYTGSTSSTTPATFPLQYSQYKDVTCIDGLPFHNSSVSSYFYYATLGVTFDQKFLTLSVADSLSNTSANISEQFFFTGSYPVSTFEHGLGVIGIVGPIYDVKDFGLVYPLFISKNRLFI